MSSAIANSNTQAGEVYRYMRNFGGITARDAQRIGIDRLAAVIGKLKKAGIEIEPEYIPIRKRNGRGTTIARYKLKPPPGQLLNFPPAKRPY